MSYYYVKSGGTAVTDAGRATTQRTGSFATMGASAYYDKIDDILLGGVTTPADGDIVCCSDLHNYTQASVYVIGSFSGNLLIISVDDANADQYKAGATESVTSGNLGIQVGIASNLSILGVNLSAEDDITIGNEGTFTRFEDSTLTLGAVTGASIDRIGSAVDGVSAEFHNCNFKLSEHLESKLFDVQRGIIYKCIGCTILSNTTGPETLCRFSGNAGGMIEMSGCDLTNIASMQIAAGVTTGNDDNNIIDLRNCKLPATWSMGDINTPGTYIRLRNCDDGNNRSIAALGTWFGTFITSNTVYANSADQVAGQNTSLEVTTTSETHSEIPFRFLIGQIYADFSSSKTITVDLLHDAQGSGTGSRFQDNEAWIEVHRPNSGDPSFLVETTRIADPFATPATNDSSSETWTGESMTSATEEKIELTTTTSGGEGWAEVWINFGVASVGLGDLFVSPDIGVA